MTRTLIPTSDWYDSVLSPLWLANKQGIVLVKANGNEYYVCGIYFTPGDKKAYAVEHYIQGQIGVVDSLNRGPVSINANDSLFLET